MILVSEEKLRSLLETIIDAADSDSQVDPVMQKELIDEVIEECKRV